MMILTLLTFVTIMIIFQLGMIIWSIVYKLKIIQLLETISSKEELLYLSYRDFLSLAAEVLKRKGYKVRITDKCGEEGNGFLLNDNQYAEIYKHSLNHMVDIEAAMKLAKCMSRNSIHRGMFITLGDFKANTKKFCHANVIECINGEELVSMVKEVQTAKRLYQAE